VDVAYRLDEVGTWRAASSKTRTMASSRSVYRYLHNRYNCCKTGKNLNIESAGTDGLWHVVASVAASSPHQRPTVEHEAGARGSNFGGSPSTSVLT
jgi:hypothetical protein